MALSFFAIGIVNAYASRRSRSRSRSRNRSSICKLVAAGWVQVTVCMGAGAVGATASPPFVGRGREWGPGVGHELFPVAYRQRIRGLQSHDQVEARGDHRGASPRRRTRGC